MTLEVLLGRLAALDVKLTVRGDRLRVEAPAGALTAELRAALAEQKAALLDLLSLVSRSESRPDRIEPHGPDPQPVCIPLRLDEPPSEWLAKRGLRIVGGDPATGTLFVAGL
jgi:hypothetical protein